MLVNKDSFSNGQIASKIWLCQELEKLKWSSNLTWIYGGWYGITAFLLLSRENFLVKRIESYDSDPECEPIADLIHNNWVHFHPFKFKAYTKNCNALIPNQSDLIINTATEHFDSMEWFNNIPTGHRVILQGNNMTHDDHCVHSDSLLSFKNYYPLTEYYYIGNKDFEYNDWKFTRYMVMGTK